VGSRVIRTPVGLGLDDHANRPLTVDRRHETTAEQRARYLEDGAPKEILGETPGLDEVH
jgi:hypothetical protein